MNKLQNSWDWVKNHIESINFGVVLFVLGFIVWLSVHVLSVESQLRKENEFLKENLIRIEQSLSGRYKTYQQPRDGYQNAKDHH